MKKLLLLILSVCALLTPAAYAHRLDEYLQATILSLGADRVEGTMRLQPGVAVASGVIARIDTSGDGKFSQEEQRVYAQRVLGDLVLKVDGRPLAMHVTSAVFPSPEQMKQGVGEIQLGFVAEMPAGHGERVLLFENHHDPGVSVYLVNSLVPTDQTIQIQGQNRNENQSVYTLNFVEGEASAGSESRSLSGFGGAFRLGMRHIAEGTDHLLFLLALLLPAPLLVAGGRWGRRASIRHSVGKILGIVTAFTLGHSFTLALAAFGVVRLPSHPVEVLIAVSILVSAVHAMRPIFPGREAVVAGLFGLVHGLAFASALNELGVSGWYRLVSLAGFNLGIESMQLMVVLAVLPSLLLLSRTPVYGVVRIAGALFAGGASAAWISQRAFGTVNPMDEWLERAARHGAWFACALLGFAVVAWVLGKGRESASSGVAALNQ